MIKISVVIPTFNRDWCIVRAIKSVLSQNYDNWQIILIDDGSIDRTKNILEPYLKSDTRIKYIYKINGGVGSARNVGIEYIIRNNNNLKNNYILFLDSDDELTENALTVIKESIKKNNNQEIFFFGSSSEKDKKNYYMLKKNLMIGFKELLSDKYTSGERVAIVMARVFKHKEFRFKENICGGEAMLWWEMAKKICILCIDEVVVITHTGSKNSITRGELNNNSVNNIYNISQEIIRLYSEDLKRYNKKFLGSNYFVYARATALLGNRKKSIKLFFNGLILNPFDLKRISIYLLTMVDYNLKLINFLQKVESRFKFL